MDGNYIHLCVSSIIVCVVSLVWINAKQPIFGDEYAKRKQHEDYISTINEQKKEDSKNDFYKRYKAKESVKSQLKDSDSAKFSGEFNGRGGAICGYVNAKNSFGGYSGNVRYVSYNGVSAIDNNKDDFSELWSKYCY